MSPTASPRELERQYEALRAQALGEVPTAGARGLAVLRRAGLVAWMRACPPEVPSLRQEPSGCGLGAPFAGMHGELASVLTEMALGAGRRSHT